MKIDFSKFKTVEIRKDCMGGKPCLKGHRITIAQIIQEVIDEDSIKKVEYNYSLEGEVEMFFKELSIYLYGQS